MRELERIKDYLMMESDFIKRMSNKKSETEKEEEDKAIIDLLRGTPVTY